MLRGLYLRDGVKTLDITDTPELSTSSQRVVQAGLLPKNKEIKLAGVSGMRVNLLALNPGLYDGNHSPLQTRISDVHRLIDLVYLDHDRYTKKRPGWYSRLPNGDYISCVRQVRGIYDNDGDDMTLIGSEPEYYGYYPLSGSTDYFRYGYNPKVQYISRKHFSCGQDSQDLKISSHGTNGTFLLFRDPLSIGITRDLMSISEDQLPPAIRFVFPDEALSGYDRLGQLLKSIDK